MAVGLFSLSGCAVLPYAFLAGMGGVAGYHVSKHKDELILKKQEIEGGGSAKDASTDNKTP
ncbi:MAG: hypothetical protein QME78_08010 [Thermodesulfobacteriota bacterium]|nr:hypothetical protein [Thermodesulfobacteriota bacterium]